MRNSRQISESEQRRLTKIVKEEVAQGKFIFPNELDRFSPKRISGESIERSNRVLLYYLSKKFGYDSSFYVAGKELKELGIVKGRDWSKANGISLDNYVYTNDPIKITNSEGEEETLLNYTRIERRGTTRVFNASLIEEIDIPDEAVISDPEAPSSIVDIIQSAGVFCGMKIVSSDRFDYDRETGIIFIRPRDKESEVDYVFNLVETLMKASGKIYRHQSQMRKFKKRGLEKIPFEEMMVVKLATVMYLADELVDISEISEPLITIDYSETLNIFKDRLRSVNVMHHYSNEAASAVNIFRKYLGR